MPEKLRYEHCGDEISELFQYGDAPLYVCKLKSIIP